MKNRVIEVQNIPVSISQKESDDYIFTGVEVDKPTNCTLKADSSETLRILPSFLILTICKL